MKLSLKKQSFPLILLLFFIVNCQREAEIEREFPRIIDIGVDVLQDEGVNLSATLSFRNDQFYPDHGFYVSTLNFHDTTNSHKLSLGELDGGKIFSGSLKSGLAKNKDYYVFGYVVFDGKKVFSHVYSFKSLGSLEHSISGFYPPSGVVGDTVVIRGMNFGFSSYSAEVFFNSERAIITGVQDSVIRVIAPAGKGNELAAISVLLGGVSDTAQVAFQYLPPEMFALVPNSGVQGDTIEIIGRHFSHFPGFCRAIFGSEYGTIIQVADTVMKVRVPKFPGDLSVHVRIQVDQFESAEQLVFEYLAPVILQSRAEQRKPK